MGKLGGFLKIERHGVPQRDPSERAHDFSEFLLPRPVAELRDVSERVAARVMARAIEDGVAQIEARTHSRSRSPEDILALVKDRVWRPQYSPYVRG